MQPAPSLERQALPSPRGLEIFFTGAPPTFNRSHTVRTTPLAAIAVAALGTAVIPLAGHAQAPAPRAAPAVTEALLRDIGQVKGKLDQLSDAIPADKYDWRPGEGVRSVEEVLRHLAAENYFLPTIAGVAAPAATGIKNGDYASVQAYEGKKLGKADAIKDLDDSFAFLRAAMSGTDQAFLDRSMQVFGSQMTGLQLWVMATTHLHEHLGQLIAYARTNNVVPPWSR